MRYIYMSNLTPEDVDLRLTTVHIKLDEEDVRLWNGLEDEKISRIAGDEANKQFTLQVQQENQGTERRLSTEVIHRELGDLSNISSLTELSKALSDYRIKTDLEINNEKIARQQLGVDLNARIDQFVTSWDHSKLQIYQAIQEVQNDLNDKNTAMDIRIKKYEQMLQDITTDSIQITMDNGEINMGAWTILSQAREWDLEIIGMFKDFKYQTNKDLDEALEDLQNQIPKLEDVISKAIEELSNAPIIKELDEKLTSNIEDIDSVHKDLLKEIADRQAQAVEQANNTANELAKYNKELSDKIQLESDQRIDALERETAIRQEQLLQEAEDRTAEIDEKLKDVWINIDEETAERLKQIEQLQDGLTQEIQHRKDGDASITTSLENYKASTDTSLANIQDSVTVVAKATESNATKLTALDGKVTAIDEKAGTAITNSALALEKANTAIDLNSATASKLSAVEAEMVTVKDDLANKADAKALSLLEAEVKVIDGKTTANSTKIDQVATGLDNAEKNIKANSEAVSTLQAKTTELDGKVTTVASDVTKLTASVNTMQGQIDSKASAQALEDLTVKVTKNTDDIASTTSKVTSLTNDVAQVQKDVSKKADASALATLDNKVTIMGNTVSSNSSDIVTLKNRTKAVEDGLTTKADASAVTALSNEVTQNKKDILSNSNAITTLNNTLASTVEGVTLSSAVEGIVQDQEPGEITKVADNTATSGRVLKLGNNNGNDTVWMHAPTFIPVDPNRLYRVKARYRRVVGVGAIYVGVACKNANKDGYVTTSGSLASTMTSSNYLQAASLPALGVWQEGEWFMKGVTTGAANGLGTLANPRTFQVNAAWFTPMFIGNYNKAAGEVEVDYVSVEYADEYPLIDATAKATQTLSSKVETLDGKVTSNSTAVTQLTNKVTTLEGSVAGKAETSALNALDSKVTLLDGKVTAQTTEVTKLTARLDNMSIGGVNQLLNSGPERTSTAASQREYLLYERSTWLKDFYNANLGKEVTISFEIKVPVAGTVQVYSGNDSAHAYQYTTPALVADTWTKVVIIAKPTVHPQNPNVARSTLEFYGTYGTGRIPTVRNVQLEAGNVPTAWSPSPRDVDANFATQAEATNTLDAKVTTLDGKVSSNSTDITNLKNSVTSLTGTVNNKADSSTVSAISSKVDIQEGKINSQGDAITKLDNSLSVSAKASANLLVKSNVVGTYNGVAYPHHQYAIGQPWDPVGTTYTLIWCAEHKRGTGDTNSTLAVYAGGGSQTIDTFNGGGAGSGKVIRKATFYRNAGAITQFLNFYMLNRPPASAGSIGTVYWAVLVKGPEVLTNDWIPSSYDLVPDVSANSSAITSLTSRTSSLEGTVSSHTTQLTSLTNSVNGKADSSAVTSLESRVTVAEGKVTSLTSDTTTLKNRVDSADGKITANTSAINTLNNKVTDINGELSAQSTAITKVNSDLTSLAGSVGDNFIKNGAGEYPNAKYWGLNGNVSGHSATTYTHPESGIKYIRYNSPASSVLYRGVVQPLAYNDGIKKDKTYTLSFKATRIANEAVILAMILHRRTSASGANNNQLSVSFGQLPLDFGNPTAYSYTFNTNLTDPIDYLNFIFFMGGASTTINGFMITDVQLQEGSVATAYKSSVGVTISESAASATAISALDTKVTTIDGKVTTQASTITQLQSDVNQNSAKLVVQGEVVDGLKASYVVKTDVNGLVTSYGVYNENGVGAFGVNADYFYVGKGTTATNGKKPFIVLTTPQTIGGVTYPAGTWIDVAMIANATIGTAKIGDAAITTAKIGDAQITNAKIANLDATKITTGFLNAGRIQAKAITADKLSSTEVSGMFATFGTFETTNANGTMILSGPKIEMKYTNGVVGVYIGLD